MTDETGTEWELCVHCGHPQIAHDISMPEGKQDCHGRFCSCPNFETGAQKLCGEENMKTTVTCPKCGKQIGSLEKCGISIQEVTLRYIKGDGFVLGDHLTFDDPEIDTDSQYYRCPLCEGSVCSSDERALEFLRG